VASHLDVGHVELDALSWGPQWTPRPREDLVADAERAIAENAWVIDGNYSYLQPAVWARADTVVWLDLPTPLVISRVYRRTLRHAVNRAELWPGTGNRQRWRDVFAPSSSDSIVRWSWDQQKRYGERYGAAMADPANAHLTFHRLRSRRDVDAFFTLAGRR
jgi:adenylate kinase family enzyme